MAETVAIRCPECKQKMNAPPTVLGKRVKCKGCNATFVAEAVTDPVAVPAKGTKPSPAKSAAKPAAAKPAPSKPSRASNDDDDANPYDVTHLDLTPRCPECANELESEDAVVCLHCGYNTVTRQRKKKVRTYDVTGQDIFIWLLPGIGSALGVIGLIVFDLVYVMYAKEWFGTEWYAFLAHGSIQMWLCIISIFVMYPLARFAIKRLIFDYTPPEVERRD